MSMGGESLTAKEGEETRAKNAKDNRKGRQKDHRKGRKEEPPRRALRTTGATSRVREYEAARLVFFQTDVAVTGVEFQSCASGVHLSTGAVFMDGASRHDGEVENDAPVASLGIQVGGEIRR